jgi:zeaxanthin glucosyltransferase
MKVLLHFPDASLQVTSMLARAFIERGHEVVCTSIDDDDAIGLPADATRLPIHTRWPMRSLLTRMRDAATESERDWLRLEFDAFVARDYFEGEMAERVRGVAPDLIVADPALVSPLQFVAHELRVPCVQLSLTFSRRFAAGPPVNSSLSPCSTSLQLAGARWQSSCLNRRFIEVPVPMQVASAIERLATSVGYPAHEVSFESAQYPALTLFPELVACEASLDFLTRAAGESNYFAIDAVRRAPEDVPTSISAFVDAGLPLIYMDLGGCGADLAAFEALWRPLVKALGAPAPWKTVVNAGDEDHAERLAACGDDILVLAHAPGSWLLQRAAVLVTTADLEVIRAAVAQQVPMIAIPLRDDQRGNAERVTHHGVGVRLRAELLSPDVLLAAIHDVLGNAATLRENLRRLDRACREERSRQSGVAVFEKQVGTVTGATRSVPSPAKAASTRKLTRVEESRHAMDRDEAWFDYASWCVSRVLDSLWMQEPDRVEAFRELMDQYREAGHRNDASALDRLRRSACARAAAIWHKGYGAVVCALHPDSQRGAWLTRLEVAAVLARAAATGPSEPVREQQFKRRHAEVSRELEAEWDRRFGGRTRVAS